MQIEKENTNKNLTLFLFAHLFIWTIVPAISNHNLPLDTIEALAWGSNLEWGFSKHPPFSAFVTEVFYQIFGSQDWAYYFLSQIFVVVTFFIIFKFTEDFFNNPSYSLISIFLLEGIYFYNYTTPEFNVNICQFPFWALTVYYCWQGIKHNTNTSWILFGLFAALGVLSKYLFVYLLVAIDVIFIYLILNKKFNYRCLVSFIIFFLILTPHLIWLTENNYITITYGLHRAAINDQSLIDHLYHPILFLGKQFIILTPFFLMFIFLIFKFNFKDKKILFLIPKLNFKDKKLLFLLIVNIFPIFLMFLTSMIMGVKIRTMWMSPFYLFFGVLFIYIFKTQINLKKIGNFITVFLILFILSPMTYLYISISQKNKRTDYPGKEIASQVQKSWNKKFKSKIVYVSGDEWVAGNLSYHLKSRPRRIGIKEKIKSKDKLSIVDIYKNDISKAIATIGYFKVYGK